MTSLDCNEPLKEPSSCGCGCGSSTDQKMPIPALPPIDKRGHILCRISDKFRMNYSIAPGLYSIGNPDELSPVLVTANYRLTCDHLCKAMEKSSVWVLVIDTKGINVWCAAGKGTFGTSELINRIKCTKIDTIVRHRNIILPQLGAPGVSAHQVTKATGFSISYGPVLASDIPAYLEAGKKATSDMRTIQFPLIERIILTPMELLPALKKYFWLILGIMVFMGIQPSGILYKPAFINSWPFIAIGLISIITGSVIFPVLLPVIPFRSFALKGMILGVIAITPSLLLCDSIYHGNLFLASASILFNIALISYLALNFTGCTPFTNISGVKREMKFSVPVYMSMCIISSVLLIIFKLQEWGIV